MRKVSPKSRRSTYTSQAGFQTHNNPDKISLTAKQSIDKALDEGKEIKVIRNNQHLHSWTL